MAKVIKLSIGKKVSEYNLLLSFVNNDDETIYVYTDKNKSDTKYAYIGKKNGDYLTNDVSDDDILIANKLLDKIKRKENNE